MLLQAICIGDGEGMDLAEFKFVGMFGLMAGERVEKCIPLRVACQHLQRWFLDACMHRADRFIGVPRGEERSALPANTAASLV
jgi:hypothetical protein